MYARVPHWKSRPSSPSWSTAIASHFQQSTVFDTMEGLCMLLKRVSYPCRYSDMIPRFGRPVSVLSLITNHTLDYIYENHGHLITQWNRNILNPRALQNYADSISRKGAPLNNCFGFVDGTVRPISRPGHAQRVVYNGHKRVHSLQFQSLALPNGWIGNIVGPVGKYEWKQIFLVDWWSQSDSILFSYCLRRIA